MIQATFRLELPADLWVREVSESFPGVTFELLGGVPDGEVALELGRLQADAPEAAVDAVRSHPDIRAYNLLFVDGTEALAHYEVADRRLYDLMRTFSVPPEFPLAVVDGRMEFSVTVTQAQFEAVRTALDGSDRAYEVVSVLRSDQRDDILTARQRECLTHAIRNGYYEIPRACTLADLAAAFDVDPSTFSETLRRAEQRVLRWFLSD
jgi:predicted DNA binding protein